MQNIPFACVFKADDQIEAKLTVAAVDMMGAVSRFLTTDIGLVLLRRYKIDADYLTLFQSSELKEITVDGQGWTLSAKVSSQEPERPTVIVRRTAHDEILVESDHPVRVLHLEDDKSGDWDEESEECVLLGSKEMWIQRFDVEPTDVSQVLADISADPVHR